MTAAAAAAAHGAAAPGKDGEFDKHAFVPGDRVYVDTYDESWCLGTVQAVEEQVNAATGKRTVKYSCSIDENATLHIAGSSRVVVTEDKIHNVVPDETDAREQHDLLNMAFLADCTLLEAVRIRFLKWDTIYTAIGGQLCLAINPFTFNLPHYTDDQMPKYLACGDRVEFGSEASGLLLPHSWAVAHETYFQMRGFDQNQSIIVSGESGAGKTEAAKIVSKYLGKVCHRDAPPGTAASSVPAKVNASSPIMEAFANAKTKRNDNSSRFGKFMKIHFARLTGMMTGAEIEVYLIEKSRVVSHADGERCYHAFYQATAKDFAAREGKNNNGGATAAASNGDSGAAEDTMFLHEVITTRETIEGVDDLDEYEGVARAMDIVGLSAEDQKSAWRVCAGVLHALHVKFVADGEGSAVDKEHTKRALERAAFLWGVSAEKLEKEFTSTTNVVGTDTVVRLLTVERARDVRDALCKALYERLFLELVHLVNVSVGAPREPENWIGLLDIFGFEHFVRNSFEQLCINLANETLQGHYNSIIFKRDMEECVEEGINTASVVFQDNQPCLDMIRGKVSLLSLLDQSCALGKSSDVGFAQDVSQQFKAHPNFIVMKTDPTLFGVRHYAGDVTYSVEGFREKNMDTMKDSLKQLVHDSARPFVAKLLCVEDDSVKKARTVGAVFRRQLDGLMAVLNSTNPHWIRCVKPHPAKKPKMFSGTEVMSQLRCAGVLETVRIRKMSFSVRFLFADFWRHYRIIVAGRLADPDTKAACTRLLVQAMGFDHSLAQAGKTKVFLKSEAFQRLSREKEKRRVRAKNVVLAFARGLDSVKAVAARVHLKFVRDIQAHARLRTAHLAVRDARYDTDKRATLALLRRLRDCEAAEDAARAVVVAEEKAAMAAAKEGAKEVLAVVFRLLFEQRAKAVQAAEEAGRRTISGDYWVGFSALEGSHLVLRAQREGRAVLLREEAAATAAHAAQHAELRRRYAEYLQSILELLMGELAAAEEEGRRAVALQENGDATFMFASGRIVIEEKSARRAVYMRARGFTRDILDAANRERIALVHHYERGLRGQIADEEQQLRIAMMIAADREEDDIARTLLERRKEAYLQELERRGAAKKRFVLRR